MNSKQKRWRLSRFGIRGVLILTTILAVLMAVCLAPLLDHSRQRGIAKNAYEMGIKIKMHGFRLREPSAALYLIGYFKPEIGSAAVYEFDASETDLTDDDVANLVGIRRLESLNLSNTKITDKAIGSIARLRDLTTLKLNHTDVTDAGIKKLATLPNLVVLETTGTDVGYESLKYLDDKIQPWPKVSFCEMRAIGELRTQAYSIGLQDALGDFSGERLPHVPLSVGTSTSVMSFGRPLTHELAESLEFLTSAGTVWFSKSDFLPGATAQWKKMNAMTTLRIDNSNITDADLVEISRQTQLLELQIQEFDDITEVGLLPLTKLRNLERLLIVGCANVDGTTAGEFRKLIPGCDVSIAER